MLRKRFCLQEQSSLFTLKNLVNKFRNSFSLKPGKVQDREVLSTIHFHGQHHSQKGMNEVTGDFDIAPVKRLSSRIRFRKL